VRGRERRRLGGGGEGRACLVGDSCVPKLHSSLRCHVSFHTRSRSTYARNVQRTYVYVYMYKWHTEEATRSDFRVGMLETPRKYSGQYIPPSFLLSLSCSEPSSRLASLLPFIVLFFLFYVVTSAKLHRESSQFRVVVARHKWILGRFWAEKFGARATEMSPQPIFERSYENPVVVVVVVTVVSCESCHTIRKPCGAFIRYFSLGKNQCSSQRDKS